MCISWFLMKYFLIEKMHGKYNVKKISLLNFSADSEYQAYLKSDGPHLPIMHAF
jgi:hypothetical protein